MNNTGMYRVISFLIDIAIIKIITRILFGFFLLSKTTQDASFIVLYSIYYIGCTYRSRRTIGTISTDLIVVFAKLEKNIFLKICLRNILMIPVLLLFTDIVIVVKLGYGQYKFDQPVTIIIPILYWMYFVITDTYVHDRITKTNVVCIDPMNTR